MDKGRVRERERETEREREREGEAEGEREVMHYWGMVGNGGWVRGVGGGGMGAVGVCILGCRGEGMGGWGYTQSTYITYTI